MLKKISVIIPVYNGSRYINRCIDSVLEQEKFSVDDLEIILLNDGSTDNCLKILKQYKGDYPDTVKVIDQKNVGVARTRNKGISLATGKYIIFLDQDDWIEPDYCRVFFDAIESTNADVVSGGYSRPDAFGKIRTTSSPNIDLEYSKYIIVSAWAKIHRNSFLKQNKILFFKNEFGEDSVFTIKEISRTRKWEKISYTGYNWFFNEVSVSNTLQKKLGDLEIKSLLVLLNKLIDSTGDKTDKMFKYYIIRTCVFYLLFSGRKATSEDFMFAYREMKPFISKNTNLVYLLSFRPRGEIFSVKLAILAFVSLNKLHLIGAFAKVYCLGKSN